MGMFSKFLKHLKKDVEILEGKRDGYSGAGIALFRKEADGGWAILLGKRSIRQDFGKWSIPGGKVEKSDVSPLAGAQRELLEETGYRLDALDVAEAGCWHSDLLAPFFAWDTFFYVFNGAELPAPNLKGYQEFSELKWIPIKQLDNYELCHFVREECKAFLEGAK